MNATITLKDYCANLDGLVTQSDLLIETVSKFNLSLTKNREEIQAWRHKILKATSKRIQLQRELAKCDGVLQEGPLAINALTLEWDCQQKDIHKKK